MDITPFSSNTPQAQQQQRHEQMQKQLQDLQKLSSAEYDLSTMSDKELAALKETTQGIEQIFVKMLVDQMRKSIQRPQSDSAAQNQGRDIFDEMLFDEYGKQMVKQGSFGIADSIFNQLTTPVVRPKDLEKFYQAQATPASPKDNTSEE